VTGLQNCGVKEGLSSRIAARRTPLSMFPLELRIQRSILRLKRYVEAIWNRASVTCPLSPNS
jgi:hypothetical protein